LVCAAVAWLAENLFAVLKQSSGLTRSIRMRLPDWTKVPPPSPSPFTRRSRRITFLPCVIFPSMRTLPTFCSAPMALMSQGSAGLGGVVVGVGVDVVGLVLGGEADVADAVPVPVPVAKPRNRPATAATAAADRHAGG
jgi:hypothetical protein